MWGKRRIVQEGIIPNVVCIAKWPRGVDVSRTRCETVELKLG